MVRLFRLVLLVSTLLLISGCAGTFRPPRYKVPVVSYEYGIGPTGPTSVLSLKMDGREMIHTPWLGTTPLDGRQDTAPEHTAFSLGPKGIFDGAVLVKTNVLLVLPNKLAELGAVYDCLH